MTDSVRDMPHVTDHVTARSAAVAKSQLTQRNTRDALQPHAHCLVHKAGHHSSNRRVICQLLRRSWRNSSNSSVWRKEPLFLYPHFVVARRGKRASTQNRLVSCDRRTDGHTCSDNLWVREVLGSWTVILLVHVDSAGEWVCWVADVHTARIMLSATDQCRHRVQCWAGTGKHGGYGAPRHRVLVVLHHDHRRCSSCLTHSLTYNTSFTSYTCPLHSIQVSPLSWSHCHITALLVPTWSFSCQTRRPCACWAFQSRHWLTLQNRPPWTDRQTHVIMSKTLTFLPNLVQIRPGGCGQLCEIYPNSLLQLTAIDGFSRLIVQTTRTHA